MKMSPLALVYNQETQTARINLYGVIGGSWWSYDEDPLTASDFQRALAKAEQNAERIDIYIHSPGGDVWEGLGICNSIKASKKYHNIHIYNAGLCASMGATILSAAKKGNRHVAKASLTMFHSASTIAWGNAVEMREVADQLDIHDNVLADIIADAFGKKMEDIKAEFFDGKDHWKSAQDLVDAGFADIIEFETEAVPQDIQNKSFDKVAAIFKVKPENIKTTNTNPDMSLFTNKLKKMHALAKVAAAAITAEQVEEINTEIAEAEIEGVTLVLDTDLAETVADAEKVPALEASVTAKDTEIGNLKTQVANLQKELKKPADDAGNPPPKGDDEQPEGDKPPVENYATSVDAELKKYLG
jgi:ATP-dependent Clp protease protease subunit